mgnify:CR=1 FL=1
MSDIKVALNDLKNKKKISEYNKLYNLYLATDSIYVKSKIILIMGKICKLFYSGYLDNSYSDMAYKSFSKLLELITNNFGY